MSGKGTTTLCAIALRKLDKAKQMVSAKVSAIRAWGDRFLRTALLIDGRSMIAEAAASGVAVG